MRGGNNFDSVPELFTLGADAEPLDPIGGLDPFGDYEEDIDGI